MKSVQEFAQYLSGKRKGTKYIEKRCDLISKFHEALDGEPPTIEAIDIFIRQRWSGYVSRDKDTFQALGEYADFCEQTADVFNKYVRDTFEGEASKAMKGYKDVMVFIPKSTKIDPVHLNGLTNDEFVNAFLSLQEFLYKAYDAIEHSSPFEWGYPDWSDLTWYGLIHNRVVMLLNALVECGSVDNNELIVDKLSFEAHAKKKDDEQIICKPLHKTMLLLNKLMHMGLHVEGLADASIPHFIVSFPADPNIATVLCSYFKERNDKTANHIRYFSYRFVEDSAVQTHERLFLAITDGEPEHIREIYYWLYSEADKYGYEPTGTEKMYCYLYKKGTKEWLLVGKGSSYHEEEFLHSVNYEISAKFAFQKIYHTHPEKIEWLKERFPTAFATHWGGCYRCKEKKGKLEECKNRVIINPNSTKYGCVKGYFYFHNPTFDDVKEMLEMYKVENKIKPM